MSNAQIDGTTDRLAATNLNSSVAAAPSTSSEIRNAQAAAHPATADLPGGVPENEMPTRHAHLPGSVKLGKNTESSS